MGLKETTDHVRHLLVELVKDLDKTETKRCPHCGEKL